MPAPQEVVDLVDRFERNIDQYQSPAYKEARLRQEFLDPLFGSLGWDVYNREGNAEVYKDVVLEDSVQIDGQAKAPDYSFRLGGQRIFFLEAKQPAVNIKTEIAPSYQLRRYGWSAKLPVSILSDFEEFAVYDTGVKPLPTDKASTARVAFWTYRDYVEKWDELSGVFSKRAVRQGSFDKYASDSKRKRGTAEVDQAFLKEIESWRDALARNIALRNPGITARDLNFAVQRTIDRVIFLRICEARGIEDEGVLREVASDAGVYDNLVHVFSRADDRYNSGIFHFRHEKTRSDDSLDTLTPSLKIDDRVLKEILSGLYYPQCPYEFSVLPADILGQVYEQFLGKVIRLTAGHQAKVEEKPEVRKAGGVYYTPSYIVDYIVGQTVGELLKKRTPKTATKLRIVDPACGSGSFLIVAYQRLLEWHLEQYVVHGPEKHKNQVYQGRHGEWRLSTEERKRILLNNIYGVDIDQQAVEVTKLSLALKVLEGETSETLGETRQLVADRVLPDLDSNIKCGNSLVAPDFYEKQERLFTAEEEFERVNVFDWKNAFPSAFESGGFDAVIGNPPYIPIETMTEDERDYFKGHLSEAIGGKYDSSVLFIVAGMRLLSDTGVLSYISSLTWWTGENYANLRRLLFREHGVRRLVELPFDVFKAYVDTGVYVVGAKPDGDDYEIYRFPKKEKSVSLTEIPFVSVPRALVQEPDYKIVLDPLAQAVISRSTGDGFSTLGQLTESTQGLASGMFTRVAPSLDSMPFLESGQVSRWKFDVGTIAAVSMAEHENLRRFYKAQPKILVRRVINRQDRLMAAYTDRELVFKKDINPFVLLDSTVNPMYLLGVVNSKVFSYLYVNTSSIALKDDFRQTTLAELRRMPVPLVADREQDEVARIVETLCEIGVGTRRASALESALDRLVATAYGLTEDEERSMGIT